MRDGLSGPDKDLTDARCDVTCSTYQDGTQTTKTFNHVPTEIRAAEAEEIGVEHLLRDVKDNGARARARTRPRRPCG